jgi:hypothetical protein
MPIPVTNDFSGRQWRIVATGVIPFGNFFIKGGVWTGGTAADVMSFTDVAGREFDFIFPTSGMLVVGEMGWISGPATITVAPPHGEMIWYVPC